MQLIYLFVNYVAADVDAVAVVYYHRLESFAFLTARLAQEIDNLISQMVMAHVLIDQKIFLRAIMN